MDIVFFYPSKVVGGAEYLFVRLAEYLSLEHQCYIVDYNDGIYKSLCQKDTKINFIELNEHFNIPEHSYILTYPTEIYRLIKIINGKNKVLFWGVHPDNFQTLIFAQRLFPTRIIKSVFNPLIRKTIQKLLKKEALIVMDGGSVQRYQELYKLPRTLQYTFCPIPVVCNNKNYKYNAVSSPIKCVWLGRLSEEKTYSLLKVLEDINSSVSDEVIFDIIGTGKQKDLLDSFKPNANLKIHFLGTITDNLDSKLMDYDLLFGMGTSVLEGAKLGVPSILVDGSYKPLPKKYKYKWVCDTNDYVLGCFLPNPYSDQNSLYMNDIFFQIKNSDLRCNISNKCHKYVFNNHSLKNIAKKIVRQLQKSDLKIEDLKSLPINKYYLRTMRNVYGVLKKGFKK